MRYGVHFWTITKGQKPVETKNGACFARIWGKEQDAIRFMAYYEKTKFQHGEFTDEVLDFYLDFTRRILSIPGCTKWTRRKLSDNRVLFRLNTKGLRDKQCLLYLTWFRYIQEMPNFPILLFKRYEKGDSDEVLFRKFQEIHHEALAGKLPGCYPNTNHGLILKDNYGSDSSEQPITIEKLSANIKANPSRVFSYFK